MPGGSLGTVGYEGWPCGGCQGHLESSLPGVLAVGDARGGSVKRVASAVGEGSMAVRFVHQYLAEMSALQRPRV